MVNTAYFVKLTSFTAVSVSFQYFADMLPTYWRYAWRIFFSEKIMLYKFTGFWSYIQTAAHCGGYTVSLACSQFLVFFLFVFLWNHLYLNNRYYLRLNLSIYFSMISGLGFYWPRVGLAVKVQNILIFFYLYFIFYGSSCRWTSYYFGLTFFLSLLLAHLSQRLVGELIVYP